MLNRLHKAGVQPGKAFDASGGKQVGLDDLLYAEHAIERNRRVAFGMETIPKRTRTVSTTMPLNHI